jgi:hypothetical protein
VRLFALIAATLVALVLLGASAWWFGAAIGLEKLALEEAILVNALVGGGSIAVVGALSVWSARKPKAPLWAAALFASLPAGWGVYQFRNIIDLSPSLLPHMTSKMWLRIGGDLIAPMHSFALSAPAFAVVALALALRGRSQASDKGASFPAAGVTLGAGFVSLGAAVAAGRFFRGAARAAFAYPIDFTIAAEAHAAGQRIGNVLLGAAAVSVVVGIALGARKYPSHKLAGARIALVSGAVTMVIIGLLGAATVDRLIDPIVANAPEPPWRGGLEVPVVNDSKPDAECSRSVSDVAERMLVFGETVSFKDKSFGALSAFDDAACRQLHESMGSDGFAGQVGVVVAANTPVAQLSCLIDPPPGGPQAFVLMADDSELSRRAPPPFDTIAPLSFCFTVSSVHAHTFGGDLVSMPAVWLTDNGWRGRGRVSHGKVPSFESHEGDAAALTQRLADHPLDGRRQRQLPAPRRRCRCDHGRRRGRYAQPAAQAGREAQRDHFRFGARSQRGSRQHRRAGGGCKADRHRATSGHRLLGGSAASVGRRRHGMAHARGRRGQQLRQGGAAERRCATSLRRQDCAPTQAIGFAAGQLVVGDRNQHAGVTSAPIQRNGKPLSSHRRPLIGEARPPATPRVGLGFELKPSGVT